MTLSAIAGRTKKVLETQWLRVTELRLNMLPVLWAVCHSSRVIATAASRTWVVSATRNE